MKLNKLMLASILLLAILTLGAVSAEENSAADNLAVDSASSQSVGDVASYNKTVYVNTAGSDSNSGSQSSPYATINKGISSVNASDNAVIYLSEGTFAGENNTDLNINLAHGTYGGSLTIIGQGQDKTFIDGEQSGVFLKSVSGDTVLTLINISFINGKANTGSMITCGGNLTVDNCLFENNYATSSQGALVSKGMSLSVTNSLFKNNTASNQGPDICFDNKQGDVVIANSKFYSAVNTGYSCGASVFIYNSNSAKVTGNTFKDIVGNYNDAALQVSSNNGQIIENTFINCTNTKTATSAWDQCGVIYLAGTNSLKGNKFVNSSSTMGLIFNNGLMNAVVTYEDVETTGTTFTLKATVSDDVGNSVASSRTLEFDVDGKKVGDGTVRNGETSISVSKLFDNGKHEITGVYNGGANATFNTATLTVNIDRTPAEYWVSTTGSDTTGDGSKNNPFNTIDYAITSGLEKSIEITIHIMDGTYNGTGNTKLSYDKIFNLNLIGENYGKTIIDGQDTNYFFYFNKEMTVTMTNLTFTNGNYGRINWDNGIIFGSLMTMNDCIIKNSNSPNTLVDDIDTQNSNIVFNNLTFINNTGNMWLGYATINNSYFADNTGKSIGGVIRGTNFITITNSKFINNTNPGTSNAEGGAIYANNILSINNIYDSNYGNTLGGAIYISSTESATFINDTFINNEAGKEGGAIYAIISSSTLVPTVTFENVKFINNSAITGGAVSVSGGSFINTTFEDNTATTGGAINILSVKSTYNAPDFSISDDSSFKNNNAADGKDIYITTPASNYAVANITGLTITFNDLNVDALADKLTATVSHPGGAVISGNTVTFFIDGNYAGIADVVNGVASYNYVGFEDGKYNLSGTYNAVGKDYIYKNGTITVKIAEIKDSITVYVSDSKGDDTTADGSLTKPFKTIKNALEYAQSKSRSVTVHVLEGNYTGNLNSNLDIQLNIAVAIVGDGENKTIINNPNANYFITALGGKGSLVIANMTIGKVAETYSQLYLEDNTKVLIDTVAFINGKGNLGGAINTKGVLTIVNSYFFNNGYANAGKYQNAIAGGAIYNDGDLTIDNTIFVVNHATRASTIANQGNLYMNNSQIIDSISAYGMNMDYRIIGSYNVGQVGNITLENTKISLSGKTLSELINSSDIYNQARSALCIGLGSSEKIIFNNVSVDGNGSATNGAYVFGGFNSWNSVGGGRSQTPKDVEVYNSTFSNLKGVNVYYDKVNSTRIFDGCIFNNVDYLVDVISANMSDTLIIKNSVIFGDVKVGSISSEALMNINIGNNWWGSNNATYYNAIIGYNRMSNVITESSKEIANPENYLVLTLNATDKTGLLQDVILAFKVFDGENLTDYTGNLPAREFSMTMVNGTLSIADGTVNNNFVNNFEAKEGNYTISATVDNQTVTYNGSAAIGRGIIEVNDITLNYGDAVIANATLVDTKGNPLANVNMTLKVANGVYNVVTDENGVASFVIGQLNADKYDLVYSVTDSKVISDVTNSSTLTINKAKNSFKVNVTGGIAGEDVVIEVDGPLDAAENVSVIFNGETYSLKLVNGSASLTVKDLNAGNYNVTVSYPGDKNYDMEVINTTFTVEANKEVNINSSDIVMIYKDGTRFAAILTDYKGTPIANATLYFTINGQTYSRVTDVNGTASIALNLVANVYEASVSFNGTDDYNKAAKNVTVDIKSTVDGQNIVKMYQNDTQFYAAFLGADGKALANTNVTFNINGVFYTRSTDEDGTARLAINLRPGNYTLTAINPINGEQKGFNVLVKSLIEASDLSKYYLNASKFEAKIYNKDGSLAINKDVSFNINGVFYKRTTDASGSVGLAINLRPGEYDITTIYDGLSMGNKVNVLPTLETEDLSMSYHDGSAFKVKTLDGEGKPLANQDVTFNVNGVFYHRTSGSDGVASLNINLNKGEYIITSMWNNYQVGNKITIV